MQLVIDYLKVKLNAEDVNELIHILTKGIDYIIITQFNNEYAADNEINIKWMLKEFDFPDVRFMKAMAKHIYTECVRYQFLNNNTNN